MIIALLTALTIIKCVIGDTWALVASTSFSPAPSISSYTPSVVFLWVSDVPYILNLKLHNCFVYFNQTINPWRMVFYFFILLFRSLSY